MGGGGGGGVVLVVVVGVWGRVVLMGLMGVMGVTRFSLKVMNMTRKRGSCYWSAVCACMG